MQDCGDAIILPQCARALGDSEDRYRQAVFLVLTALPYRPPLLEGVGFRLEWRTFSPAEMNVHKIPPGIILATPYDPS